MFLEEYRRLATAGLDRDEFECALAARKYAFDAATPGTFAKLAALEQFLNGDPLRLWRRREQLDQITRADVNRTLKRDLKGLKPSTLIVFAGGNAADKKSGKKS